MRSIAFTFSLLSAFAQIGCEPSLTCGDGSLEIDGTCVAEALTPTPTCGAGTVYNAVSGVCEVAEVALGYGVCGDFTARVTRDDGLPICVGTGGSACGIRPPCPEPEESGNMTLCGRVYELETSDPLSNDIDSTEVMERITGKVYEPIGYIDKPNSAVPIGVLSFDGCGYYAVEVAKPFGGNIGIVLDDAETAATDVFVPTAVAAETPEAGTLQLNAFVTRNTTDMAWAQMAGNPEGAATLSERGVYVPIYIDTTGTPTGPFEGSPTAGVTVSRGTNPTSELDFYFADQGELSRSQIDPSLQVTGRNGTGIVFSDPGIGTDYSGVGPAGCTWEEGEAGMVAGTVFAQVRRGQCR